MPGSKLDAAEVLNAFLSNNFAYDKGNDNEIVNISSNCGAIYRSVFKFHGVVYKIAPGNNDMNEREHEFFSDHVNHSWSSETSLYLVNGYSIICMPFYERDTSKFFGATESVSDVSEIWRKWMHRKYPARYSHPDFHDSNQWFTPDGTFKIIDAGGYQ